MDWAFRCEWKGDIPVPPEYTFAQAFNYLNPESNSFYILEKGDHYIQCGGAKEACTVEFRESSPDGTFRHYVFFDPSGSDEVVHIPMSNGGVRWKKKHCLHFRMAVRLFECYFNGQEWPSEIAYEDITAQFK